MGVSVHTPAIDTSQSTLPTGGARRMLVIIGLAAVAVWVMLVFLDTAMPFAPPAVATAAGFPFLFAMADHATSRCVMAARIILALNSSIALRLRKFRFR